ncbi:hypothetical protein HAX54_030905 [Datura stramonium]|uniref:Uncharacterized protein n=1 Tax=Datura stramonium TaxID=4076 RepID=A0ABS8V8D5_DATST|nr:hypothetical protein [Datura stramonium]
MRGGDIDIQNNIREGKKVPIISPNYRSVTTDYKMTPDLNPCHLTTIVTTNSRIELTANQNNINTSDITSISINTKTNNPQADLVGEMPHSLVGLMIHTCPSAPGKNHNHTFAIMVTSVPEKTLQSYTSHNTSWNQTLNQQQARCFGANFTTHSASIPSRIEIAVLGRLAGLVRCAGPS